MLAFAWRATSAIADRSGLFVACNVTGDVRAAGGAIVSSAAYPEGAACDFAWRARRVDYTDVARAQHQRGRRGRILGQRDGAFGDRDFDVGCARIGAHVELGADVADHAVARMHAKHASRVVLYLEE